MPPPTVLFLHAHPDDECILTGATLAKAHAVGLRTVVVYGTRGDAGETNADLAGEALGDRRVREAEAACADLGVARVEWLPYDDSGMADSDTAGNPAAFSNADATDVAAQLAELLRDEKIVAVVGYDSNGTYGHPDHVQVHRVAHATGAALGSVWVFDATYSREYLAGLPDSDGTLDPTFAESEDRLTHFVQGERWMTRKLYALRNHLSQIPDDWDVENPDLDAFRVRFGTEWFVAASPAGATDLGSLTVLFDPKADWPGPPDADSD